jgi:hypothetical protein
MFSAWIRRAEKAYKKTAELPFRVNTCANDIPGKSGEPTVEMRRASSSFNCDSTLKFSAAVIMDEMLS